MGGTYNWNKIEIEAKKKMYKFRNKIKFIKKSSNDALKEIPSNLDYIYLDGNHNYEYIKQDLENYYKKTRKGGILAGHDIDLPDVLRAVLEFTQKKKINFFITKSDWVIIKP